MFNNGQLNSALIVNNLKKGKTRFGDPSYPDVPYPNSQYVRILGKNYNCKYYFEQFVFTWKSIFLFVNFKQLTLEKCMICCLWYIKYTLSLKTKCHW